ncbi:SIS domain-containing protein [Pectinatus frisingensis]|uniref:D-sedoheptulose-7-phosphate isomerase n=1 Tax=Pectinatus frisingensis TaxID=865 RepID=UPI0015F4741F|nr:SIS domain-containing protein [Pectinatus frisingensis]
MIKKSTLLVINELMERYSALFICKKDITNALIAICNTYRHNHKLLICGNGGSAADSEHIVGELMKGFLLSRKLKHSLYQKLKNLYPENAAYFFNNLQESLPALSLVNQVALTTAFSNDQSADLVFAQQVLGLGNEGDILLGISTSGNSDNIIYAMQIAKAKHMITIALTGKTGGKLQNFSDICIKVPELNTYKIQELHLPIYHALCIAIENEFFT